MKIYNNVVKGKIMTHKNSNPFSNDDVIKDENKEENNVETSETEAKTEE